MVMLIATCADRTQWAQWAERAVTMMLMVMVMVEVSILHFNRLTQDERFPSWANPLVSEGFTKEFQQIYPGWKVSIL
eukprot:12398420-Karenia_brevis.AAC.1